MPSLMLSILKNISDLPMIIKHCSYNCNKALCRVVFFIDNNDAVLLSPTKISPTDQFRCSESFLANRRTVFHILYSCHHQDNLMHLFFSQSPLKYVWQLFPWSRITGVISEKPKIRYHCHMLIGFRISINANFHFQLEPYHFLICLRVHLSIFFFWLIDSQGMFHVIFDVSR